MKKSSIRLGRHVTWLLISESDSYDDWIGRTDYFGNNRFHTTMTNVGYEKGIICGCKVEI